MGRIEAFATNIRLAQRPVVSFLGFAYQSLPTRGPEFRGGVGRRSSRLAEQQGRPGRRTRQRCRDVGASLDESGV